MSGTSFDTFKKELGDQRIKNGGGIEYVEEVKTAFELGSKHNLMNAPMTRTRHAAPEAPKPVEMIQAGRNGRRTTTRNALRINESSNDSMGLGNGEKVEQIESNLVKMTRSGR